MRSLSPTVLEPPWKAQLQAIAWGAGLTGVLALTLPKLSPELAGTAEVLPFSLLEQTRGGDGEAPVYPAPLRALDGKVVSVTGFAVPYDDPQRAVKLLLCASGGGCFFCAPARSNATMLVHRASDLPFSCWNQGPVTFTGRLRLFSAAAPGEDAGFLFTLDHAELAAAAP